MPSKNLPALFHLFNLTVNLMLWKKILSFTLFKTIIVSGLSTLLRVFLMGRSGCPTKRGDSGRAPLQFLITGHILEKKVSLIAFRQILPQILPAVYIFSYTVITYWKKLVRTKYFNTKQCPAGLSSRIISHYSYKHLWETMGWGKAPPNS